MTPIPIWNYRCKVLRVIDGDTLDVEIDVGFQIRMTQRLRLLGINTPELKRPTMTEGQAATDALKELLQVAVDSQGWHYIHTEQDDAFGRYLATIHISDTLTVNAEMIRTGHAVAFP